MSTEQTAPKNIDESIAGFPEDVRERLEGLRRVIHEAAPGVEETIKYGMPTFMLNGNLVYFSAFKKHIGFYPRPAGIEDEALLAELAPYEAAKSAIRLPFDRPIPYELIAKLVKIRLEQNLAKVEGKKKM
jgi:uncharacterized protein YdhG (YjbR/CyaY superfamily)